MQKKDGLKIVIVGHVDHGKSTVIGRLLYDTESLPEGAVEKVKRIARETGKPFEYAYLLDAFEEEQKQGITIDTTQIQFYTKKREYVLIDAPGHKEFLKNMISGAANANAALLVIDAQQGVQEQSKRHGYMLSLLGIRKVYVIINKMDLVDYAENVFQKVVKEMGDFLGGLGVYPQAYIPVSGFYGENISQRSALMPWYKGEALLDALDLIPGEENIDCKPLRLPIQDVYKFDDRRIIAGRIEAGTLAVGDEIVIYPGGRRTFIESVEHWSEHDRKTSASAGESTGITVHDEFFNQRGEVITHSKEQPLISNRLRVSLFWLGKTPLVLQKKYRLKLATQEVECEVETILRVIDAASLGSSEQAAKIACNDVAEVILRCKEEIVFDLFDQNQATGRFVLVDGYDVAGGGIVVAAEAAGAELVQPTFVEGAIAVRGDIFDEFYYDVDSFEVTKVAQHKQVYKTGDQIPTEGESYTYPDNFDIIILRDQAAVSVRNRKITGIYPLAAYQYTHQPLINGRGFGIKVQNEAQFRDMLETYRKIAHGDSAAKAKFSNTWFFFNQYRRLTFYFDYVI